VLPTREPKEPITQRKYPLICPRYTILLLKTFGPVQNKMRKSLQPHYQTKETKNKAKFEPTYHASWHTRKRPHPYKTILCEAGKRKIKPSFLLNPCPPCVSDPAPL
jgi:hypothetical protein